MTSSRLITVTQSQRLYDFTSIPGDLPPDQEILVWRSFIAAGEQVLSECYLRYIAGMLQAPDSVQANEDPGLRLATFLLHWHLWSPP